MASLPRAIRITAHILLFLVAVAVFYLGLGIGLSWNPAVGTLLWLAAALICGRKPVVDTPTPSQRVRSLQVSAAHRPVPEGAPSTPYFSWAAAVSARQCPVLPARTSMSPAGWGLRTPIPRAHHQ